MTAQVIRNELNKVPPDTEVVLKCGANGDCFTFKVEVEDNGFSDGKVYLESEELNTYLQSLAKIIGIDYPEEFNCFNVEYRINELKKSFDELYERTLKE